MGTQEKPAGTAMGRRPQSIGEEFGRVPIRDDPELGTYFLKPPKCHIAIYRFSYWRRDPEPAAASPRPCRRIRQTLSNPTETACQMSK